MKTVTRLEMTRMMQHVPPATSTGTNANTMTADVIIVDTDVDCADALQLLLSDVPGVGYIQTAESPDSALELLAMTPDVSAYAAPPATLLDGARQMQIVFLDVKADQLREASVRESLASLRAARPDAAIVLLCLYPDGTAGSACSLADRCVPKDTSYHDLRALIDDLRRDHGTREGNDACACA
jgi:hypothetical protein